MKKPIDGATRVALMADDIARMFGISRRTLYRPGAAGDFPRPRADRDRTPSRPDHATPRDPRAAGGPETEARRTTKCNG